MRKSVQKEHIEPYVFKKTKDTITCGVCGYVRRDNEQNPIWQCPGCQIAYNKIQSEKASYTKEELKKKNEEYLERKSLEEQEQAKESQLETGSAGLGIGILTFISGLSSACSGAIANPAIQLIGAVIAVTSITYMISKFFGS